MDQALRGGGIRSTECPSCFAFFFFEIYVRGCGIVYIKVLVVFITFLAGICISLLKEAGRDLVLSFAFNSVGALGIWW